MCNTIAVTPKFPLGLIVLTANATAVLSELDVVLALQRHQSGDWGNVDQYDQRLNEDALRMHERLSSVYHTAGGVKFYIITEWDRSITTVLLPEEY